MEGLGADGWLFSRRAFGEVHMAMDQATGLVVGMKVLHRSQASGGESGPGVGAGTDNDAEGRKLEAELGRLRDLKCNHLVQVLGYRLASRDAELFVELVPSGSLLQLTEDFGPLEGQLQSLGMRQVMEGLRYLHTREPPIAHGNLKGSNVLVKVPFALTLTDYGMPGGLRSDATTSNTAEALRWAAPEVAWHSSAMERTVSGAGAEAAEAAAKEDVSGIAATLDLVKADLWSAGCILLHMATAEPPWGLDVEADDVRRGLLRLARQGGSSLAALAEEGSAPVLEIPSGLPADGREVAQSCLQPTPQSRPSSSELLWHRWLIDAAPMQGGQGKF